jgi:hypothetical protein
MEYLIMHKGHRSSNVLHVEILGMRGVTVNQSKDRDVGISLHRDIGRSRTPPLDHNNRCKNHHELFMYSIPDKYSGAYAYGEPTLKRLRIDFQAPVTRAQLQLLCAQKAIRS